MKRQTLKWSLLLLSAALLFTACKKDENDGEGNDEEVITTVVLKIGSHTGGNIQTFTFDDPDGPGGAQPTKQDIVLAPNTMYHFDVELMDKTKEPDADITEEVEEEGDAHRIYFQPSGGNITITALNNDDNGLPLGTSGMLTTGAAGTGTLRVVLRHYGGNPPNKAANDPVDSPKSSADVDVTFNTRVQ